MKHIYVVLIKAHTGLGKIAREISHYEYTHIAVSIDGSLEDFVTFSRRKHYLPLDAGFMHEYRDYYAFGKHKHVKIKVFKIPVTNKNFADVNGFISQCENDNQYLFNLFSMITMPFLHGFKVYKTHNCMSFTAKVVQLTGAVKLDKPYYKYSIKDLDKLLSQYQFFEGYLERKFSMGYSEYMQRYPFYKVIYTGANTIFTLSKRLLFYKNRNDDI